MRKCRETEAFWVPFTQNIDAGTEKELRTRTRGASTEMLVREGTRSQPLDRAKMDLMDDSAGRGWGSAHTPPTGETGKSEPGGGLMVLGPHKAGSTRVGTIWDVFAATCGFLNLTFQSVY